MAAPLKIAFVSTGKAHPASWLAWNFGIRTDPMQDSSGIEGEQNEAFIAATGKAFELVDQASAECLLSPYFTFDRAEYTWLDEIASASGQRSVVTIDHDELEPLPTRTTLVLRTSAYASTLGANEDVMPAPCSDPYQEIGNAPIPIDAARPAIGFCGYTGTLASRLALPLLGKHEKARGLSLRHEALAILERSRFPAAIVRRTRFRAGMKGDISKTRHLSARREYLENMLENQYGLCVRGAGNFSRRFYELLALGRIPVVVDTDERLPLSDSVDWAHHVIRVEMRELRTLDEKVAAFLARSPRTLAEISEANRQLWVSRLSPEGYFTRELPAMIARR